MPDDAWPILAKACGASWLKWGLAMITSGLFLLCTVLKLGLHHLLQRKSDERHIEAVWEDQGPTPMGEHGFTPQGLTFAGGRLIFANTWKDQQSRVYEIDPVSMKIGRFFDMPPEALHTSGLAAKDGVLWAVDYRSNQAYCIDLESSFARKAVQVRGTFSTTLEGTSACSLVQWKGEELLAISDFMNSKTTIFVRTAKALVGGTAESAVVFSYRNEGFSQGLEFFGGYLYESENKLGVDVVNVIDLDLLKDFRSSRKATIAQFDAPSRGVEDLAWSGERLWTSDETVFRFYSTTLLDLP